MEIFPAILENSRDKFKESFGITTKISDKLHIDVADGKFVLPKSLDFSEIMQMEEIDFGGLETEVHLMVENPLSYLQMLQRAGVNRVIFHIETINDIDMYIYNIINYGLRWSVAINPETPVDRLFSLLESYVPDFILFMTVEPGAQGREIMQEVPEKIKQFNKDHPDIKIGADGGVNAQTIEFLMNSGVKHFAVGSAILKSGNPEESYKELTGYAR